MDRIAGPRGQNMEDIAVSRRTAQYVILGVDKELFAIDVDCVQEILDHRPITRVPHAPDCMSGMIDVRGQTVPVIDLRLRFGLPVIEATAHTRIIVLNLVVNGRRTVLGMMVDRVYEVSALADQAIEAPPDIGLRWQSKYIAGIGRRGDAFVIVINLSRLFSSEDAVLIAATAGEGEPAT